MAGAQDRVLLGRRLRVGAGANQHCNAKRNVRSSASHQDHCCAHSPGMRIRAKHGEPTPHAKSQCDPPSPKDGAEPRADDLFDEASCNGCAFDDHGDTTRNNEGVYSSNNSTWADLWFFSALLLVPLVSILSASTLHTLIFALASAPLAAASVNFYRRVSNAMALPGSP